MQQSDKKLPKYFRCLFNVAVLMDAILLICNNVMLNPDDIIWYTTHEKGLYAICSQQRLWSACAQVDQGLCCPLTESMAILVYIDEQRVSRLDCTYVHLRLYLQCSHMA